MFHVLHYWMNNVLAKVFRCFYHLNQKCFNKIQQLKHNNYDTNNIESKQSKTPYYNKVQQNKQ